MKSYTDLEQSERLAKILPLESADMSYTLDFNSGKYYISTTSYKSWVVPKYAESYKGLNQVLPCWSLVALLNVIPEPSLIQNQEGSWMVQSWDKKRYPRSVGGYNNPVDACVDMIIKLKESNLLNLK